uniref:Uncharacterized protein n=1 Tax=Nyssomyia neivai TaxID=330878 RepID=A0A1L8D7Y9_9DIPT
MVKSRVCVNFTLIFSVGFMQKVPFPLQEKEKNIKSHERHECEEEILLALEFSCLSTTKKFKYIKKMSSQVFCK